jgi:hypothetical protein
MEALEKVIALANQALPILAFIVAGFTSLFMYIFHGRAKLDKESRGTESAPPVMQGTPIPAGNTFEIMTLGILRDRIDELEEERDKAHAALRANGIPIP